MQTQPPDMPIHRFRRAGYAMALVPLVPLLLALLAPRVAQAVDLASLPEDTGATAWMLVATALVLLMVPGLAMF